MIFLLARVGSVMCNGKSWSTSGLDGTAYIGEGDLHLAYQFKCEFLWEILLQTHPEIMCYQISGHPLALSHWHIKFTIIQLLEIKGPHYCVDYIGLCFYLPGFYTALIALSPSSRTLNNFLPSMEEILDCRLWHSRLSTFQLYSQYSYHYQLQCSVPFDFFLKLWPLILLFSLFAGSFPTSLSTRMLSTTQDSTQIPFL